MRKWLIVQESRNIRSRGAGTEVRMRDVIKVDGGFIPSVHEWYGSDWRYQGLIDTRIAL